MAEKTGIALTSIAGFPADTAAALAQLWITTAEELTAAAALPDGARGLADYLGILGQAVAALVATAAAVLPAASRSFDLEEEYPTGALDEPEALPASREVDFGVEEIPAKIDYHDRLPPPRDQGERGTCVAFSSTAAREFLLGTGAAADLSEQFLYWACKRRDNYAGEGTLVKVAMAVLEDTGVCQEEIWRYNPVKVPGSEGQGPAPV